MDEQTSTTTTPPDQPPATGEHRHVGSDRVRDLGQLRRTTGDRYLGGVAGGIGRHFDVDPTVVRVVLAVAALFGGAGLIVYVAAWIFVPEDGRDRAALEIGPDGRRAMLLAAGLLAVLIVLGTPFADNGWGLTFPLPLIVVGLVVVALVSAYRQRSDRGAPVPPAPWPAAPVAGQPGPTQSSTQASTQASARASGASWTPPPARPTPPQPFVAPPPPRARRTGPLLFWPTVALVAIALGVLGIVDVDGSVLVSAYAALALGVVAVMLLVGAFVGRPGGLVALGLAATLALGVTSIVDAAGGSTVRSDETYVAPTDGGAVRSAYTDGNGRFTLDLRDLPDPAALDGRTVRVDVGVGEARVLLPEGVVARVDAEVAYAGSISVDGQLAEGVNPTLRRTLGGSGATGDGAPVMDLEVDARAGQITVENG
ncbi:PspC domain-containing protein [Nocardioides scoriae]|nr:PspC domain-containing protein [Nocardioides scoriae]